MGYRITGLRAVTLGSIVAIAGVSIPTALAVTVNPDPADAPSAGSAGPAFASRLPAVELLVDAPAPVSTDPGFVAAPSLAVERVVNTAATPAKLKAVKALSKPKPKPKASQTWSMAASGARKRIVQVALAQRGDAYVRGASGPDAFDCSGLVRYAYRVAGVSGKLGGGHSASAMYAWGVSNGLTSRSNPRIGDVVIWGSGSHAGIYIGNGRVISALNPTQDIKITGLHALGAPFTAFIHTRI